MRPIPSHETKNAPEDGGDDLEVKAAIDRLTGSVDDKVKAARDAAFKVSADEVKGLKAEIAPLKRPRADDGGDEESAEV